jgi:hypothetical protein
VAEKGGLADHQKIHPIIAPIRPPTTKYKSLVSRFQNADWIFIGGENLASWYSVAHPMTSGINLVSQETERSENAVMKQSDG